MKHANRNISIAALSRQKMKRSLGAYKCTIPGGGIKIIRRPAEFAADDTPSITPVLHVVETMPEYDYVVLLQVTSPLRTAKDIDGCIERCLANNVESCVSICEAGASPYWMYTLSDQGIMHPILKPQPAAYQRQKLPKVYQLNGAIYVATPSFLHRERSFIGSDTLGFVMSTAHSGDIDTLRDFEILEFLHSRN